MLLDDLGSYSETKTGAALLGGEVGQEEPLTHFVGKSGARIGNSKFYHSVFKKTGSDAELAIKTLLHGFRCVVDEVAQSTFECLRVSHDKRKVGRHLADDANGLHATSKESQRVFDDGVEVGWLGPSCWELGKCGELVHEGAHALDRGGN